MSSGSQLCPRCLRAFEAFVLHPPERRVRVATLVEAGPEGGIACAAHKRNAAVTSCSRCGVFMCTLCQVEADGKVWCPACFDRLSAEGALESARTSFRDWAGLCHAFALLGLPLFFLGLAFGPGALYCGVRAVRQNRTLGIGGGGGTYLSMVLGVAETAGGALFVASLFRR
jgi:hypothetical protein